MKTTIVIAVICVAFHLFKVMFVTQNWEWMYYLTEGFVVGAYCMWNIKSAELIEQAMDIHKHTKWMEDHYERKH